MMKRLTILLGAVLVLGACEDHDGIQSIITGPQDASFAGTWTGDYTSSNNPGAVFQATLQLTQTGTNVSGTLTTSPGRSANLAGSVTGSRLTANWTWTDLCTGTASATLDMASTGTRITGSYGSNDCLGLTSGGLILDRQP
ncbi:MAG TPA: hypothetical protein VMM17_03205 [Gemmatimonadaceae bacterium]|nr:hypothetical protein [Gemmatimonadaceae bacterium]